MYSGNRKNNIKVIGPIEEVNKDSTDQKTSKAIILQGRRYCPNDSTSLVYRVNTDTWLCKICGFVDGEQLKEGGAESSEQKPRSSISENIQRFDGDNSSTISMNVVPMDNKRRGVIIDPDDHSDDPDIQAMQEKGYTILDSKTETSEVGTYNVEEAFKEKEKYERYSNRNRFSSWANR